MCRVLSSLRLWQAIACVVVVSAAASCTAPRSIIHSGRVTPHGEFKIGANVGGNVATEPISQLKDITEAAIEALANRDTVFYNDQVRVATKAALAYTLDPVGPTFDFYVRYGLVPRVDVGYKYASGVHVLDAMYQFMGPLGGTTAGGSGQWYGSMGVQYAGQSSGILEGIFLDKLAPIVQFKATRRDVLVPLVFSKSFGVDEEFGNVSFGVAYNHTFLEYGLEPGRLYEKVGGKSMKVEGLTQKQSFPSYGFFVNAKIGARRIYLLPALSMYYQNYGTYNLLQNEQESYSGITIVPSLGLQIGLGQGKTSKR
ncbi:hypothetical protein ACD591_06815 [Rufibacter glacialis]|uniref:Outer membrane beta-barrel protein n=1 Tax=Rufibacter glacialis TaxID=1259555 RepID=A0A5M8QBM8_9BACT|nr:hypothetical protein [Rufibacter glacialis]KAA6433369.1 hypothetical protein FOE74_12870 [Rufibacter glacialis]